jgi:metallo-beta-lactamase family protein
LPDPNSTIIFAGFQAEETRGRRLVEGEKEIKIHGEMVPVRAEIVSISNLSAHADYQETLHWLGEFRHPPQTVFVTHGETAAAESLKLKIEEKFGWKAVVPKYADSFDL